jgi:hypothetical protein
VLTGEKAETGGGMKGATSTTRYFPKKNCLIFSLKGVAFPWLLLTVLAYHPNNYFFD